MFEVCLDGWRYAVTVVVVVLSGATVSLSPRSSELCSVGDRFGDDDDVVAVGALGAIEASTAADDG